jgi:hypothetical protein
VSFEGLDPARRRAPPSERSLLWRLNTALAGPLASLFGLLGVGPGQLSLQSLWITAVGVLRMASGEWAHAVQGALIVYLALLLDRADHLLSQKASRVPTWSAFLGLLVDRLVDAALLVALAVLLAAGVHGVPSFLPPALLPLPTSSALVLAAAALATMLVWRLARAYADVLYLRTHLLAIRRLPGPSAIPRGRQGVERVTRLLDRDFVVLVWLVGILLAQVQLALLVLLLAHGAALAEAVALFWHRSKDPEPQASRILAREYP